MNGGRGEELKGTFFCGVESSRKLLMFVATEGENGRNPLSNLIMAIGIARYNLIRSSIYRTVNYTLAGLSREPCHVVT